MDPPEQNAEVRVVHVSKATPRFDANDSLNDFHKRGHLF